MFDIPVPSAIDKIRFKISGFLSNIARIFGFQQQQLIVCGYPRSGTSLLYNMLSTSLSRSFLFTTFEKYFIYLIHKFGNIASKAPLDINHLHSVDELNVNNKKLVIIVVIRDIRDVITSKHPIFDKEFFIGHDYSYWPEGPNFERWNKNGTGVIEITERMKELKLRKDVAFVKYEELVRNPDEIQQFLQKKFSLKFESKFSDYHTKQEKLAYKYEGRHKANNENLVLEGKKIVNKKSRWKSREFDERIIMQFTECPELFNILIDFGYEEDKLWFKEYEVSEEL